MDFNMTRCRSSFKFYLRMAAQQRWQVREVARQIDTGLFERVVLDPPKLSTALRASKSSLRRWTEIAWWPPQSACGAQWI